ncbi:ABC transporter substrate-binding protein [Xanthobacter sp. KR7-225]|uniref:ABC transporter substrate-binding protein n=1 Tax=Xanthobacter sp. KR7-225 TaxID=3156613 RepID=UPI0032B5C434
MLRRFAIGLALAAIGISNAAAGEKITIAQSSDGFLFTPIYIAVSKKYFAEEGIDAEVVSFKGGATAMSAVIGGSAQVYVGVPAIGLEARSKGQAVKAFGAVMTEYAINVVISEEAARKAGLTHASSTAERLAALKGLRIGITGPGSATDQLVRYLARGGNLDPERDLTLVPIGGGSALLAALGQKRIDGFALSSPFTDQAAMSGGAFMLFNLAAGQYEPLKGFLFIALIAQDKWLASKPAEAAAVVRAISRAQKLLRDDPGAARTAVISYFQGTQREVFDVAFKTNLPAFPATPRIDARGIQQNLDFIEATSGRRLMIKPEEAFTNAIVEEALKSTR